MTRARPWIFLACALTLASIGGGCHRSDTATAADDAGAVAPFLVSDASEGLLLTWIDEKGDFHVEQKVTDVPIIGKDAVRVVDPNRDEGTHAERVFVADLRVAKSDGTYPVRTMTRDDFDALAVARRAKNAPTLATAEAADAGASPSANGGGGAAGTAADVAGRPSVIVYGASWCGACKQAKAYFRHKGVTYIEKDIEEDPKANAEMQSKLRRAGLRSGSIPVLDVRGRIMVGFDPRTVDAALGAPI